MQYSHSSLAPATRDAILIMRAGGMVAQATNLPQSASLLG
jgi:hypothetical protein